MATEAVRSFCYNLPGREICNPQHLCCSLGLCKMSYSETMQSELSQIITNPSPDFLIYQPFKARVFPCARRPLT
jgi:hypothetical protein